MIVENLPALQQWLSTALKPLCDADPEALTKYVIALLKKNTSEEELRCSMHEQLEIFLQGETLPFVTRLFDCIRTKEYENVEKETADICTDISVNVNDSIPKSPETAVEPNSSVCEKSPQKPDVDELPKTEVPLRTDVRQSQSQNGSSESSSDSETSEEEREDIKTDAQNDVQVENRRRWCDKRSRSASTEVSPNKKKNCNGSFSKSGNRSNGSRGKPRWSPIKRRIRRDIQRRRRSRSPLPLQSAKLYNRDSDRSRSRSGSPIRRRRAPGCGKYPNPPSPESNSLLDNMTNKCSVKSVVVKPASTNGSRSGKKAMSDNRTRCLDFDEKGLCLRGELCPYDHGTDPVVLQELYKNESVGNMGCAPTNFTGKLPCDKQMNFMNPVGPARPPPAMLADEYYPESPSIVAPPPPLPPFGWGIPRRPGPRPRHLGMDHFMGRGGGMMRHSLGRPLGPHMLQGHRQLIPIPVDGIQRHSAQQAMALIPENPFAIAGARMVSRALFGMRGRGRGTFDFNRLGTRPLKQNGNCCLEVRKIPRDMNKIESLISHFSRFGHVVTIQIGFDSDPEGALVIFGSHSDALNAYRSTDAVLNNRFIKVYWYNTKEPGPKHQENLSGVSDGNSEVNRSGDDKYTNSHQPPPMPDFIRVQNERSTQAFEKDAVASDDCKKQEDDKPLTPPSLPNASQSVVPRTEPPVTEPPKKNNSSSFTASEVQRKQEMMSLLNAQIQEQKQLITKLEVDRNRMTQKQRDEVLQIIKNLQTSCEELKVNISSINGSSSGSQLVPTTVPAICIKGQINCSLDEIRRQLLDAELSLYMREKGGEETVDLEKKILQLREEEMHFNIRK